MARIRHIGIRNFRGIDALDWSPSPGLNCLIGAGDGGKTTILDAIDLCIGARRTAQFSDADFHDLNPGQPIAIQITLGDLPDALRSMEGYGQYLRGYIESTSEVVDEPGSGIETVLTLQLIVASDLEPSWSLFSDRAATENATRSLAWADRVRMAPTRIGGGSEAQLGWRRGSVLARLTGEEVTGGPAMLQALRDARATFGSTAQKHIAETLKTVDRVASDLGVPLHGGANASLDPGTASVSAGTVSLHDARGVPLRNLGTGSARLLVAGLQRAAAAEASIALIDELEHGLEPHRIIALLGSLGAKEKDPPLQVFATTHSPVAVRELSAGQLNILRRTDSGLQVLNAGEVADVQGTMRVFPEALLAKSIIVCEGASEVGLLRGLDRQMALSGTPTLMARAVALVDAGGITKVYSRAGAFTKLGYRTMTFRDDDVKPDAAIEVAFEAAGGKVASWGAGRAIEDALFGDLGEADAALLLDRAIEIHGEGLIDENIKSASSGKRCLADRAALLNEPGRLVLAKAARSKPGWFKSVSWMEDVGFDIVGPGLSRAAAPFQAVIQGISAWME
ncbi:AAA family ATPase [Belnapia sp. T18]|uniref:AAA family ATPase n=1 Tax=Belnapia arida TaxID=2804533 RepID=A0ABS1U0J3_9PROT|nr:ATP-binding protein [Belnapia arida]MBL6078200.1 AAA family ATPase [Belnapia arida]